MSLLHTRSSLASALLLLLSISIASFRPISAQPFNRQNATASRCTTPDGQPGNCNFIDQCPALLRLSRRKPLSERDRRHLQNSQCVRTRGQMPIVCCPRQHSDRCGVAAMDLDRIFGGSDVVLNKFPWMAMVEYDTPAGLTANCGGSLVSERFVLTAAHCIHPAKLGVGWRLSSVRLGEWDTTTDPDCVEDDGCAPPVVHAPIAQSILHQLYDPADASNAHDIGLLRTAEPVQLTDYVRPICLPMSVGLRERLFRDQNLTAAGWGAKRSEADRSEVYPSIMQSVAMRGVSIEACSRTYRSRRLVGERQFCAGGLSGVDTCRGDSGAPIMALDEGRYYAVGVVSFGPTECGMVGWPGVYTNVAYYVEWLLSRVYVD